MASAAPIDQTLRIGSVRLAVADLPRSIEFYERVLGLPLISRDDDGALLGVDRENPALELTAIADPTPVSPHDTGLFHVAWLHPSRAALAETVQRVVHSGWLLGGASDHGVSEALYLSDPDGLGIEVYADRPLEQWPRPADGQGVEMVTLPLDLDDLMAQAPAQAQPAIAPGTSVGHVHLKVSDVPRALAFYRDALGLDEQAQLPSAAFLSGGGYHHHVGLNSWQSRGASAPPESAPGLRNVGFELGDAPGGAIPSRAYDGQLVVSDPDGQRLTFLVP